ncbi:RHS repeat-associated core domain-containing protein [Streptomyces sp. NPDC093225]|uniref:RHS repeat-associated core domain-containing protein n=1 Tax=Streptomyces sp. NPDC093225 TaxID=3366034 RepID=UPI0037FEC7B1
MLFSLVAIPEAQALRKPHPKVWTPPKTSLPKTKSVEGALDRPGKAGPRRTGGVPKVWKPAPRRAVRTGSVTVALPGATAGSSKGRSSAAADGPHAAQSGKDAEGATRAGELPVLLTDLGAPKTAKAGGARSAAADPASGAPSVRVAVRDQAQSKAAGAFGPLVTLQGETGTAAQAGRRLRVSLDVAALQGTGSWGDRARLVALPACALTTPKAAQCRKRTPVAATLDARTGQLTADITLPATAPTGTAKPATASGSPAARPSAATSAGAVASIGAAAPMAVLAAEPAPSGSGGSFAATPLSPSMSWSAGSNAGNFTYSYTFDMPTSLGGAAPGVQLGYDSSAVDGMTAANNAQSSWIGDGWSYHPGFVARNYKPCLKSGIDMSGDLCWAGQSLSLNLAGHSGQVVKDDTTGALRLQGDDGTQITPLTGLTNGAWNGEGFKVTTTDGTQYYFGANYLPGGDKTDPASNSVNTVPVYHPKPGNPCYSSASGTASWCPMASQWNLDYVVDLHGNLITYKYDREDNYYARGGGQNNGTGTRTAYTRYSNLKQVAYGQRLPEQIAAKGTANPAVKMDFTTSERCMPGGSITCDPAQRTLANQAYWPDTPLDQACGATGTCTVYGPTFWTSKRLTKVETQVLVGTSYRTVDSWALNQVFSDPGDGTKSPTLWLDSIRRTGSNGLDPITLPPVKFTAMQKPNRVDGLVPAAPQFNRPRMTEITTETGGRISIGYKDVECSRTAGTMPASEQGNTMACMPVKWVPPGSPSNTKPVDDWFHKYLVSSVVEESQVTSGVPRTTEYGYGGGAAWHRNDSEFADDDTRTWDNFRGYQTVTTTTGNGNDGPKSKSVATFLRGMGGQVSDTWGGTITDEEEFAGFVRETQTFESVAAGAKVVSGELSTPWRSNVTATYTPPTTSVPKVTARYVSTSQVKERARLADDTWRTTQRDVTYDETKAGRVLTVDVRGDVTKPEQRQCTTTSYATGTNAMLLEFPYRVLTLAGACGQTPNASNTISDTLTLYDGLALGTIGDRALQTSSKVLAAYNGDGSANYRTTVSAEFDKYGRQTATTDPNSTDATHPTGARTQTVYVPADGSLPTSVEVTNPLGWKSTTTLDPGRARPTRAVDENGHFTDEAYDALGRLTSVWQPGRDKATQSANRTFAYDLKGSAGPATITSQSLREDGSYSKSIQIHDGFGRVRQTQAMPPYGTVGRVISDAVFDSQGRQVQTTPSYFNNDSGPTATVFVPQDAQIPAQTWNEYDGLGRVTVAKFMSYGQEQWRTTTNYAGADRVDVTPPTGGFATSTITDARGATVEVRQYKSGSPTGAYDATKYAYDVTGRPTVRTDAAGNEWRYTYDLMGQLTSASDPDAGDSSTVYDAGGKVTRSTDARGKSTSYTYDLLGRKTAAYSGTTTTDASKKIADWSYDTKKKGKLDSATRYVGGAAYVSAVTGYDVGYRATGASVTIPSTEKQLAGTYTVSSTYSPVLGLPKTTTLPAAAGMTGERITNSYDVDGNLIGSSGKSALVTDVQYDAFGRPTRTTVGPYGTQVVSTQQYDPATGRVVQNTLDKQTGATHVDLTSYTYSKAGSLTSVKNVQDGSSSDLQCFSYDYLGRLTAAWTDKGTTTTAPAPSVSGIGGCTNSSEPTAATATSRVGGPAPYWQSYSYDLTGNRTKLVRHDVTGVTTKDQTVDQTFGTGRNTPSTDPTTGGGTGGPHALMASKTTVGGTAKTATYKYDAAGNTTSIQGDTGETKLAWDDQGKIGSAEQSSTTDYVYDATGKQLIRRTPGKVTLFLGSDELSLDTVSGTVTNTRTYAAPGGLSVARVVTAGVSKLYYQAADPHGTNGVQFDAATLDSVRRPLDPFGNGRGTPPSGSWAGSRGFVGGTIEGTGFTTLGARQYDPATGRFLSVDPLFVESDPQSWNAYAYANNNPIDNTDPDGTCVVYDDGTCRGKPFISTPSGGGGGGGGGGSGGGVSPAADVAKKNTAAADAAAAEALRQKQAADEALAKAKQEREELMSKIVDVVGDLIGFNDARDCFTKGDVMGCINTALNFVPWAKVFKAVKVGVKAFKLWREGEKAYDAMRNAQRIAREAEDAVQAARKTIDEAADMEAAIAKAEKEAAEKAAKQEANFDDLVADLRSAGEATDPTDKKKQYKKAGRALEKHHYPGRASYQEGQWPAPTGKRNPWAWNEVGLKVHDEILDNVDTIQHFYSKRYKSNMIEVRAKDGRGTKYWVREGGKIEFYGFLDK